MKPRKKIGSALSPNGARLDLVEHDGEHILTSDGSVLMNTRNRRSEGDLARLSCEGLGSGARILVGGLGMGFTLRTALDMLPDDAEIIQVELIPEIVEWNKGPLGEHAKNPIADPRVKIVIDDVRVVIQHHEKRLDAIILDVDNGPTAMVSKGNSRLYNLKGLYAAHRILKKGGRLAIWSANPDQRFLERLNSVGFDANVHRAQHRDAGSSNHHVVFVATRVN